MKGEFVPPGYGKGGRQFRRESHIAEHKTDSDSEEDSSSDTW